MKNRHIYSTTSYDRKKGSLNKDDYVYMRDLLEIALEQLQNSDLDKDSENGLGFPFSHDCFAVLDF